mmetsp:Transcript_16640/g.31551  ORF Transcript_16640/g.31551 Transcript_16640/m.31551 type:complete len:85 (+) Transcript_16640:207-461(+)
MIRRFCGTRSVAITDARVSSGKYMLLKELAVGQKTPTLTSKTKKLHSWMLCSCTIEGIASAIEATPQVKSINFSTEPPKARYCL